MEQYIREIINSIRGMRKYLRWCGRESGRPLTYADK
jgi:hypothetical protein